MSNLFIPVGLPGCGKSTWGRMLASPVFAIHSTDDIRDELGHVYDANRNNEVFDTFHKRIGVDLEDGLNVYADATNLSDFAREHLRKLGDFASGVHVIVFTNTEAAVRRNVARDRVVPPEVMDRVALKYEQALRDIPAEGYDSVTYISAFTS